jgi:hypothetical protein
MKAGSSGELCIDIYRLKKACNLVRRVVLYNICAEFGFPAQLVRLNSE